ncbi:MAG TPA: type II toxin-antitoxin system mRNA interferase toxin, RelE/StbE family [Bdellovibrionota bacterium]|nr:type II toxin-antitoxin system mRNA interferase toxin, RelE/StbE family [Bdellovibrionota bacterium]
MWTVWESQRAIKQLDKCPKDIVKQYEAWRKVVELTGPFVLRSIPGYRDHALKGEWAGARSSSLNIQWRVIYVMEKETVQVKVLEVNPHEYR